MKTNKPEYYSSIRNDILRLVPQGITRVLEVGCGTGATGRAIKERAGYPVEVTGIEIEPEMAEKAKGNIDNVIAGNVEIIGLPFDKGYFDCLIYGDVLEHLVDPWKLLARHCALLKEGGFVVASIPNIAHYRTIKMLFRKEWNYEETGIFDRTHLRFFTIKGIKEMFGNAGLEIIKIEYNISASKSKKFLNKILLGILSDHIVEQYIILARKSSK